MLPIDMQLPEDSPTVMVGLFENLDDVMELSPEEGKTFLEYISLQK